MKFTDKRMGATCSIYLEEGIDYKSRVCLKYIPIYGEIFDLDFHEAEAEEFIKHFNNALTKLKESNKRKNDEIQQ